jgi:hypothetical protein
VITTAPKIIAAAFAIRLVRKKLARDLKPTGLKKRFLARRICCDKNRPVGGLVILTSMLLALEKFDDLADGPFEAPPPEMCPYPMLPGPRCSFATFLSGRGGLPQSDPPRRLHGILRNSNAARSARPCSTA